MSEYIPCEIEWRRHVGTRQSGGGTIWGKVKERFVKPLASSKSCRLRGYVVPTSEQPGLCGLQMTIRRLTLVWSTDLVNSDAGIKLFGG